RNARSQSPFDGHRRAIGHPSCARDDLADPGWNLNRSLWRGTGCAHRTLDLDLAFGRNDIRAVAIARRTTAAWAAAGTLEPLANFARLRHADAPPAFKGHPGAFLRTNSLCLGDHLRDGLHRHEREGDRRAHGHRSVGRVALYHPGFALRG